MAFTLSQEPPTSHWRDLYIVAAARAIESLGSFMAITTLVLVLQPVSGVAVSALILASTVPVVVLAPLAGRLVDRIDSRTLLIGVGSAQVVIALVVVTTDQVIARIALMGLVGCCQAVIHPTFSALTPSIVRRDHLPRASAISQTANMVGMLTGPAAGGFLVGAYGVRVPLLLHAVGLIAIVVAGALVKTRRGGTVTSRQASSHASGATAPPGWRLWHDPLLRSLIISLAAVLAAVGAMNVVDVFLVRGALGAPEAMYGALEATWTAGVLSGTWLVARMASRVRDDGALVYGLLATLAVMCAMFPLAATVGAAAWLVPLWIVAGAGNGGVNVYGSVLAAHRVPEQLRGRAYATISATVQGAGMGGYAAGGLLVDAVPVRPLVAGLGFAGMTAVGLLVWPVVRAVRHERGTSDDKPSEPTTASPAPDRDQRD